VVHVRSISWWGGNLKDLLRLIYPPRCIACKSEVAQEGLLCAPCRKDTPFIFGLACATCGQPLPGENETTAQCDDCLANPRPWSQARAVMVYSGQARRLILAFKHGDRPELGNAFAPWMAAKVADIVTARTVIIPVPIHALRLLSRKYNQAAVLANGLAKLTGLSVQPDALKRVAATTPLEGIRRQERRDLMKDAINVSPRAADALNCADVLLVADVMTTGATLTACCDALRRSGAKRICVVVLARVALDT